MKKGIPLKNLFKELNVGEPNIILETNKWLENNRINKNLNDADFNVQSDPDIKYLIVTVNGNAVFEDISGIDDYIEVGGIKDTLKFLNTKGTYTTILSHLTPEEILQRIKKNYHKIYADCLGKTDEEENIIIFGRANVINQGVVQKGEDYLNNLPLQPSDIPFLDLADQILNGCLDYPKNSNKYFTDEFGVLMDNYANSLIRKFSTSQ